MRFYCEVRVVELLLLSENKDMTGKIVSLNTMGIFKIVVFSAAEAEFGSRFINTKEATILHATLIKLSHPQLPTPVLVDNCTVDGLTNDTIKNSDPVPLT